MSKRSTSQRYVAEVAGADGCARSFAVLAESETAARERVEVFLALHWEGYTVRRLVASPRKYADPPVPLRGVGAV